MTDLGTTEGEGAPLDPQEVSDRSFPTAFRGFDPVHVRSFLGVVADELRRLHDREAALRAAIDGNGNGAGKEDGEGESPTSVESAPEGGEQIKDGDATAEAEQVAGKLVEEARAEADRLVREAKERVATLGSAATAEATRVLDEARADAVKIRATASDDLKGKAEEVEATAVRKIAEAELEAAAIRVKAREESDATIAAALERGREMVSEAQAARERMLADLAKRKRAAQSQLEQLRVGRDRLLDTLRVARRSIDEMTTRFDAGENGSPSASHPPSSGTPSGSVSTTPGVASTDARPRPVASATPPEAAAPAEPLKVRPVRTRAVAIGEAPPAGPRPQITAPQAAEAKLPASSVVHAPDAVAITPAPTSPTTASPDLSEPAPREERRSSALRILRRNKAPDAPPPRPSPIGRDSHSEGVRIIGRTAEPPPTPEIEPPPEPEPEPALESDVAPAAEPEPEFDLVVDEVVDDDVFELAVEPEIEPAVEPAVEPEFEPEVEPEVEVDEPAVAVEVAEPAVAPMVDPEPAPLAKEEIRPRIEDLFARIRADREATTASARQVLGMDTEHPSEADAEPATERVDETSIVTSDADEAILQSRDAVLEPLVAQLSKRLKRALQDEQNSSLDRLRTSRGPAKVDQVLSRPDDQATPYRHLALSFLEQAARAGAAVSPHGTVAVTVDDLAGQLADDLAGALRSRIDTVLETAASDDLDLSTLSERISSVYREWKVQKVERLAMHYLVSAHERGGFLAHPEETPLRWVVDDDGSCPDCEDNALAGPTPRGRPFPTGQLHPPAHLGCRCLLTTTPT